MSPLCIDSYCCLTSLKAGLILPTPWKLYQAPRKLYQTPRKLYQVPRKLYRVPSRLYWVPCLDLYYPPCQPDYFLQNTFCTCLQNNKLSLLPSTNCPLHLYTSSSHLSQCQHVKIPKQLEKCLHCVYSLAISNFSNYTSVKVKYWFFSFSVLEVNKAFKTNKIHSNIS